MSVAIPRGLVVLSLLSIWGCPPPAEVPVGPNGQAPAGQNAPPDGGADASVPAIVDLAQFTASFTQDQVKAGDAGDHVTVQGTIEGVCEGYVRVQAIQEGAHADGEGANELITFVDVEGTAAWELLVPKRENLIVNGLCDADRDGTVDASKEGGSPLHRFESLDEDTDGVVLVIADLTAGAPPRGDSENNPDAGEGSVAPPPDAPAAGGAPPAAGGAPPAAGGASPAAGGASPAAGGAPPAADDAPSAADDAPSAADDAPAE
jgi:hypothetical protein